MSTKFPEPFDVHPDGIARWLTDGAMVIADPRAGYRGVYVYTTTPLINGEHSVLPISDPLSVAASLQAAAAYLEEHTP